eukprot:TRINITY_DN813_c0_g1_i4.p1 TRINITY_DN813_c0_g1~~TRINITY_DN813_c0_g1_i4.p1  ORF type:complete len:158 (+),score=21.64 TRINITY_DN813_c0_g1_i4:14-487(+)
MKAAIFERQGPNETPAGAIRIHDNIPVPVPKDDEVLVKIYAAALNPVDYKILLGYLSILSHFQPKPFIPGFDFSGVVESVGKSCKTLKSGDHVYGMAHFLKCGALAEYVAINESLVSIKPSNLNFEEAASIPLCGLTSYQSLVDVCLYLWSSFPLLL